MKLVKGEVKWRVKDEVRWQIEARARDQVRRQVWLLSDQAHGLVRWLVKEHFYEAGYRSSQVASTG